jgi:hypothetical protein
MDHVGSRHAGGRGLALVLALVSVAIGLIQLAEPVFFARVVGRRVRARHGADGGYHAERGSGPVRPLDPAGTVSLFWLRLGAMREQLTAIVSIVLLVSTAISMDVRTDARLSSLRTRTRPSPTPTRSSCLTAGVSSSAAVFEELARGTGVFARMVVEGGFTVPHNADESSRSPRGQRVS